MPISNLNFCRIFSQEDHHMRDWGIFSPSYSFSKGKKVMAFFCPWRKKWCCCSRVRGIYARTRFSKIFPKERNIFPIMSQLPELDPLLTCTCLSQFRASVIFPGPHTHMHFPHENENERGNELSAFLGENWKKKLRFSAAAVFHRSSSSPSIPLIFLSFFSPKIGENR